MYALMHVCMYVYTYVYIIYSIMFLMISFNFCGLLQNSDYWFHLKSSSQIRLNIDLSVFPFYTNLVNRISHLYVYIYIYSIHMYIYRLCIPSIEPFLCIYIYMYMFDVYIYIYIMIIIIYSMYYDASKSITLTS